ncbi:hypothetical protein NP493_6835g00000 [Ridgeia piscesae]|uniref:Uncharacterized protein n=1 Tax=Ridgeia piscesae TaxID=27915 RepID=A0AAD9MPJ8_RIDPI|nr:hypothetical protein NP493_6835g00000 [Ridgeia piscesae]
MCGKLLHYVPNLATPKVDALTAKSPFCNPNGIGVSLERTTTRNPWPLSITLMMARTEWLLIRAMMHFARNLRMITCAILSPHRAHVMTTNTPRHSPYKYPAAMFSNMYPHVRGNETTVKRMEKTIKLTHRSVSSRDNRTYLT